MIIPFRPKKKPLQRIKEAPLKARDAVAHALRRLPTRKYAAYYVRMKAGKAARHVRYAAEDAWFGVKRLTRHTEIILFSALIVLAAAMILGYGGESFLVSVMALLLLILTVVIYGQLKFQRRLVRQYVPVIDAIRLRKCEAYSDRIRMANIYGAEERMDRVRMVRNFRIRYDVINDSYSPISIDGVGLVIKLKKDRKITIPPAASILDVEPKRTRGTEMIFRLKDPVSFYSIEWMELDIRGNCKKKVRIKPHLYVNLLLREKVPRFVFEPLDKFLKRPELAAGEGMPESK